ncbi:substrate-binding domain-containing protein [Humibacter albus]|uniref:substrate-binding domain-containing protein n=1 Tax=Humibacter albus TaxID=427754 RepID=UPI0004212784|nr:substrate-binding domain-containing protein [Humibacter albus]
MQRVAAGRSHTAFIDARHIGKVDAGGARLAVEHLVETGRTRIAMVNGPTQNAAAQNRAAGTVEALAEAGLELVGGTPLSGDWSEHWGREAAALLLRRGLEFDAVFAASDQIARGVADALRESSKRIPQDVAVVGVDNWDVMVAASRPPLTTVDLNLAQIGHRAADILLDIVGGQPVEPGVRLVPCTLVKRESSALS